MAPRKKIGKRKPKKTPNKKKTFQKPSLLKMLVLFSLLVGCGFLMYHFVKTFTGFNPEKEAQIAETTPAPQQETTPAKIDTPKPTPTRTPERPPTSPAEPSSRTTTPPAPPTQPSPTTTEQSPPTPSPPAPRPSTTEPTQPTPPSTQPPAQSTQSPTTSPTTPPPSTPPPAPTPREQRKPYQINPALPKICIIVDDFGNIGNTLFSRFNSLDKEVAFAILPDYPNSKSQAQQAVAKGREVIIHIPMQPESTGERLEPNTILTSMTDHEIQSQIESWMYDLSQAVGANNHMGSLVTRDERVMHTILTTLQQNDLFFIDSVTIHTSVAKRLAQSLGIKTIGRDIFLDHPNSNDSTTLEKINQIKNYSNRSTIVVITHCHNQAKYNQLVGFIDKLKDEGYQLIPPSRAVR